MNVMLLILSVILITFLFGSTSGWVVHWVLHTKMFKNLSESHNVHHQLYTPTDFESEDYRSAGKNSSSFVFIPIITLSILILFLPLAYITGAWWIYIFVVVEGAVVGYLNDKIHDAFHIQNHWLNKYSWFIGLKNLHLVHHINPNYNHGIIWFGADKAFKTYKAPNDR